MQPPTTATTGSADETTAPAAPTVDTPSQAPAKLPQLSLKIVLACAAAFLLFVASVSLLYYTWLPRQNPNAMIVIIGNAEVDGAEVTVDPIGGGASGFVTDTIKPADNHRLRFHVPPGLYHVKVVDRGNVILDEIAETRGYPPWGRRIRPREGGRSPSAPTTRFAP